MDHKTGAGDHGNGLDRTNTAAANIKNDEEQDTAQSLLRSLRRRLKAQDDSMRLLIAKSSELDALVEKLRCENAKRAIHDLQGIVKTHRENKEEVTRTFNNLARNLMTKEE